MRRRDVLLGIGATLMAGGNRAKAAPDLMTPEEIARRTADFRNKSLANFPLKLIETTGADAYAKWQELKASGHGIPVVLG